jgi:S1-C subfamily serine protease
VIPRALLLVACLAVAPAADEARSADRAVAARSLAAYVFVHGGSGVVISADGLVLTNHHVIDGEPLDRLEVGFAGGRTLAADLLGTDPVGDIALLRIRETGSFPYVAFAAAESIRPGMEVFAVGNPWGLGDVDATPTLTHGVLSTPRIVRDDYTDALQVDAPVNPGNSGGPSFDAEGRLLGINGQIRTLSGMRINSGVGLAICATQLQAFLPLLRAAEGGYVHHTAMPAGLRLADAADGGIAVAAADEGLPLAVGEQVLAIAGRPAMSLATAHGLFESLPYTIGCTIPVRVRTTAGGEEDRAVPAGRRTIPGRPWHGLVVGQRGEALAVEQIDPGSPAAGAEIRPGDMVVAANGRALLRKLDFLKAQVKLEIGDRLELTLRDATGKERLVRLLLRLRE